MYKVGIDIGGTKTKIGVVDGGVIVNRLEIDTVIGDVDLLIKNIVIAVNNMIDEKDYDFIGIAVTGKIYENKLFSNTLKIRDFDFKESFSKKMKHKEIMIINDSTAATLAELLYGNLHDVNNGVMMTLGTGIGSGIVINRKLYLGTTGNAGEIGHQIIIVDGEKCQCGQNGCYQAYASTSALVRRLQSRIYAGEFNEDSIFSNMNEDEINLINAKKIFEAYDNGEEKVKELINEHMRYVAIGISNLVNILDLECIVIGGGISSREDILLSSLQNNLEDINVDIKISKMHNDAGIIGAANLQRM